METIMKISPQGQVRIHQGHTAVFSSSVQFLLPDIDIFFFHQNK